MGKIFCLMGKSASGKDSVYKEIVRRMPKLCQIVLYTTRPIRSNEVDGVEYHFCNRETLDFFKESNLVIEERTYDTAMGMVSYFMVDDGQVDLEHCDYLMIGTLESYVSVRKYFGSGAVVPFYLRVEDGIRLERALLRERSQMVPRYDEMCRRFLADEIDFLESNLKDADIFDSYDNEDFFSCVDKICEKIKRG